MTEIPQGWEWSKVGELGEYINGRGFKKSEWSSTGRPIIRIQNLTGSGSAFNYFAGELEDRYVVPTGSLLVSWAATLGVYRWDGPEGALNQHIFRVRSFINEDFHRYLLEHALDLMQSHTHGSGMVHITRGRFDDTPAPLPPLAEQERIVAAIEEALSKLDAGEAGLRIIRQLLRRTRESVWDAAVTGRLVQPEPTDTPASKLLTNVGIAPSETTGDFLPALPEDWAATTMGAVSQMSLGKMLDAKAQTGRHPTPYLRNINVRWGSFDLVDLAVMDIRPDEYDRVAVAAGDLVVCEGGEPGRCAVWRAGSMVIQKALHRVRPVPGVSADYLALVLAWWKSRHQYESFITGTTIKHIPKEKLKLLPIPLPPPEAQLRIVAEVERQSSFLDACDRAVVAILVKSAALRRSVLKAAFDGRLVPQDPTDEPAAALLERIRHERAAAPKAKSRRAGAKA